MRRREAKPRQIGGENSGLWKLGASRFDLRDPYYLALSLPGPAFAMLAIGLWAGINLLFAALYMLSPGSIANAREGSFSDAFFFSVETLATVGYGVMAPATTWGHIVSAAEIFVGMAFTAIGTGLLFVRFSRAKAKVMYADNAVMTTHNGSPALMLRIANDRMSIMSNANARLFVLMAAPSAEGTFFRRIQELHLVQPHMPMFVMPWTLIHIIDPRSPLHGLDADALKHAETRLFLAIEARDQTLGATVNDLRSYPFEDIRFGMRFADMVTINEERQAIADLTRIGILESDSIDPGPVSRFRQGP